MAHAFHVVRRSVACHLRVAESGGFTKLFCRPRCPYRHTMVSRRSYLSATYTYQDVWRNRLSSGLLSKLRHEEFYVELRKRLDANREVSAVDMDIFANLVQDQQAFGLLLDLLALLRKTAAAPRLLAGTHFAVVQSCLEFGDSSKLINIVQDRVKYGIFLASDNASIAMDKFLMRNDYHNACRIAVELMLQEDFGTHALSRSVALLSCVKYFESVMSTESTEASTPTDATEKITPAKSATVAATGMETLYPALPRVTEDEDEEADEMLIYVHFIKDPFFDDHFDLRKTRKLVGKTLYMAAVAGIKPETAPLPRDDAQQKSASSDSNAQVLLPRNTADEALLNSSAILGLIMYRKLSELKQFLAPGQPTPDSTVSNDKQKNTSTAGTHGDAEPSRKIPVTNDLIKKVEQFFAVSSVAAHTADVADDQLHVMERPSDRYENLSKEPDLPVTQQTEILAQLHRHTNPVADVSMLTAAENLVRDMATIYEPIDVSQRRQQLAHWKRLREDSVAHEIKKHEIESRLQAITARRVQLADDEDVLFFFERKSDWERMMDAETLKELKVAEEAEGAPYDYRVQEPGYEENQTPAVMRSVLVKPSKAMQDAFDAKKQKLDLESGRLSLRRDTSAIPLLVGKRLGRM